MRVFNTDGRTGHQKGAATAHPRVNNNNESKKMSQTIKTKILPATDTLPTRIRASQACWEGKTNTVTISAHPAGLGSDDAHRYAASQLMDKLNWFGTMKGGSTREGMIFVFDETAKINRTTYQENDQAHAEKMQKLFVQLANEKGGRKTKSEIADSRTN
tara:strand:+ start:242 stop:718 length:477 start_codon:yes stop_codon:yes gene_type:complete